MAEDLSIVSEGTARAQAVGNDEQVATNGTNHEDVQLLQERLDGLRVDSEECGSSTKDSGSVRRWKESGGEVSAGSSRTVGEMERKMPYTCRKDRTDVEAARNQDVRISKVTANHLLEMYDFDPSSHARDLASHLRTTLGAGSRVAVQFSDRKHALVVFDTEEKAKEALEKVVGAPQELRFRIRGWHQASEASRNYPIHRLAFPSGRTRTSAVAARRMIAGALQMNQVTRSDLARRESKLLAEERRAQNGSIRDRE